MSAAGARPGPRFRQGLSGAQAWLLVSLLLALPALLLGAPAPLALQVLGWSGTGGWDLLVQEPWRLWSAAWPHLSAAHLWANLAGAGLVALLGLAARLPRPAAWAWAAAWPLTHLGLLGQPGLAVYGGLSGVLHAGVAVCIATLLVQGAPAQRRIAAALLLGLAIKLALEWWADPARPGALLPWPAAWWPVGAGPAPVLMAVPRAHLAGSVAGLVLGALVAWRGQVEATRGPGA